MIPGLAIDYTRSMKVNTDVELLVQESFQLCSAMKSSVALLLLLSKTGCRGTAKCHPDSNHYLNRPKGPYLYDVRTGWGVPKEQTKI